MYETLKKYEKVLCVEDVIYNGSITQKFESWLFENNKRDFVFSGININEQSKMCGCVEDILEENLLSSKAISNLLNEDKT